MQSTESLETELLKTKKSIKYGFPQAKKRFARLKRRMRRRKRNEDRK